jgi:hypothetical protein
LLAGTPWRHFWAENDPAHQIGVLPGLTGGRGPAEKRFLCNPL